MVSAGGLSAYLTNRMKDCVVTARLTGGSSENVRLLADHKIDLGFSASSPAYQKAHGVGKFKGEGS